MFSIGLVDDRFDQRDSFKKALEIELEKMEESVPIIDISPLKNLDDYLSWIQENEIAVLILDEKLHEAESDGILVDYDGHELGEFLRKYFKDLPMYVVTSWENTEELKKRFRLFNLIISRTQFSESSAEFVNLFLASGRKFSRDFQEKLSKLTEISQKIAMGNATEKEIEEIRVIQEELQLPNYSYKINDRAVWLRALDEKIQEYKSFSEEIEDFLRKMKK